MVDADTHTEVRLSLLEKDISNVNSSLAEIKSSAESHRVSHSQITDKMYSRMEDIRTEFKEEMSHMKSHMDTSIAAQKAHFDSVISAQTSILNDIDKRLVKFDKMIAFGAGIIALITFTISKLTNLFGISIGH